MISKAVNKNEIESVTKEWIKQVIVNSPSAISLGMQAYRNIVDDEKNTREGLRLSLEDEFDVYISSNIKGAKDVLESESIDVLVTDLRLGAEDGMELIELSLKMAQPPISIMMTAYGSVDTAVEAMKRGAYHFVTKPLNIDQLEILIKRALKSRSLKEENTQLKKQVQKKFTISNIRSSHEQFNKKPISIFLALLFLSLVKTCV